MKLGPALLKILSKTYEGSSLISMKFKAYDLAVKTDEEGNAVLAFLGKLDKHGQVKGVRYARTLKKDAGGTIIKDHWELKGPAT